MKVAQLKELANIENAQKVQFVEFSEAWDKYMNEFEETALEMMDKIRGR